MIKVLEKLLTDERVRVLIEPWPDREYFIFHVYAEDRFSTGESVTFPNKPVFISMYDLKNDPEDCKKRLLGVIQELIDG